MNTLTDVREFKNSPLGDGFSKDALGEILLIISKKIVYGYIVEATKKFSQIC